MANRYWVATGTGSAIAWNATAGTKWSTTSGGAGGASVPTASDDVFFDANSGDCIITSPTSVCRNLNTTGWTNGFVGSFVVTTLYISGNLTLSSTMNMGGNTAYIILNLQASSNVTFNGAVWAGYISFDTEDSHTITLLDNCHILGHVREFFGGTLNLNGFDFTCGGFIASTIGSTRTLAINLGAGDLIINNTASNGPLFIDSNYSSVTISESGGRIVIGSSTLDTNVIEVYDVDFTCPLVFTERNAVRFTGTMTFSDQLVFEESGCRIELDDDIIFGPTLIFTNTIINGLWSILISSNPGTQRTITQDSGTRTLENIALQDINFTGGASFIGENCLNLGNVSGIDIEITSRSVIDFLSSTSSHPSPRDEDYFLFATTTGPTDTNPFGTSSEY